VRSINPEADIRPFHEGINRSTIDSFLDDVDVVVDSLDFYCFNERLLLYARAREKGLWVVTAPPMGFGFTLLAFNPKGMRFEDYFGFYPEMPEREMVVSLIAGIAPKAFLLRYLDLSGTELGRGQMPSVAAAPFLIAGVIATEVVNLLTGKRPPLSVPTVVQYDALLRRYRRHVYPLGMRGPLQRLKRVIIKHKLARADQG
jgi:molybdopterin/thiamine biosynthesis adenylyltransferase